MALWEQMPNEGRIIKPFALTCMEEHGIPHHSYPLSVGEGRDGQMIHKKCGQQIII